MHLDGVTLDGFAGAFHLVGLFDAEFGGGGEGGEGDEEGGED